MAILFIPCSASFSAIPRPIPRDAPVIRAVCCVSVIGMTPSRSRVRIEISIWCNTTLCTCPWENASASAAGKCVATTNFATAASHPFYTRLNQRLAEHYFDDFVEGQCQPFYAEIMGRPGLPPGMYFPLLLIGY